MDRSGLWRTDFTKIRVGSLARANGGYIYFSALDALIEPGVWAFLKRTLKNRQLNLQPYDPFSFLPTALKPEQIPLDVKVVMIGDSYIYHILYNMEEDFKKIFKIKADFDTEMPREAAHINDYVCFMKKIVEEEKLPGHRQDSGGGDCGVRDQAGWQAEKTFHQVCRYYGPAQREQPLGQGGGQRRSCRGRTLTAPSRKESTGLISSKTRSRR